MSSDNQNKSNNSASKAGAGNGEANGGNAAQPRYTSRLGTVATARRKISAPVDERWATMLDYYIEFNSELQGRRVQLGTVLDAICKHYFSTESGFKKWLADKKAAGAATVVSES